MAYKPRATATQSDKVTTSIQLGPVIGVDFRTDDCSNSRTPDSVNMYYSTNGYWETHPGFRVKGKFHYVPVPSSEAGRNTGGDYYVPQIYGIYKYKYIDSNNVSQTDVIIHAGNWLWRWKNYPNTFTHGDETTIVRINADYPMRREKSKAIQFNDSLVILDSEHFYRYYYDSSTSTLKFREVSTDAFIPQTYTAKDPNGANGKVYQDRNMLQPLFIEGFVGDGTTTIYKLSLTNLDTDSSGNPVNVTAWYMDDGVKHELTIANAFTSGTKSTVRFATAPPAPSIAGTENVYIQAKKTTPEYKSAIVGCSEMLTFDGKLFLTGNPKYPNTIFWSGKNDCTYFSESYQNDGAGKGPENIKAFQLLSDNSFLTIKESTLQDGSYAVWQPYSEEVNDEYITRYKCSQSNSTVGTFKNTSHAVFMDDNVFVGPNGLNAVSRSLSISNERNVEHRSTLIDNKLLNEDLKNIILEQHGTRLYMLCTKSGHIYIADSLMKNSDVSVYKEYEWSYLENIGIKGYDDTFYPAEYIKSLDDNKLFIGARSQEGFHTQSECKGFGYVMMFNFDMTQDEDKTKLLPAAYSFEREIQRYGDSQPYGTFTADDKYIHIGDYVDTPFTWFNYSNYYKKLIRKYNDLYIEAMSKSNILIAFRTENMFLSGSRIVNIRNANVSEERLLAAFTDEVNIINGQFDFSSLELDEEFTFETLNKCSYALRKLKAKKFRRLQIRLKSAKKNRPFGYKAIVLDAEVLAKKIK